MHSRARPPASCLAVVSSANWDARQILALRNYDDPPFKERLGFASPARPFEAGKAERSPVATLRKRATTPEAERSYAARG